MRDSSPLKFKADVIVRSTKAEQVSAILKLASRKRIPVTPRGAGTGAAGSTANSASIVTESSAFFLQQRYDDPRDAVPDRRQCDKTSHPFESVNIGQILI